MLPAVTTFVSVSEAVLEVPSLSFETAFTPWDDCSQFLECDLDTQYCSSPKPVGSSSGSDEPVLSDPTRNNSTSSFDHEPNQTKVPVVDERKRRRMISNRESARRSRMRKQKHLENLRNQVNQLKDENQTLRNRLRYVMYHCQIIGRENERLLSEHSILRRKLSNLHQMLLFKQLQQSASMWSHNNMITSGKFSSSLITS